MSILFLICFLVTICIARFFEVHQSFQLDFTLYRAKGCEACGDTGYKGRTGVHELLGMTPELRSLVYKEASVSEMKSQAMQDGMRTLVQDAIFKVIKGDTDIPQVQILGGDH